jgi:hypothetical protein
MGFWLAAIDVDWLIERIAVPPCFVVLAGFLRGGNPCASGAHIRPGPRKGAGQRRPPGNSVSANTPKHRDGQIEIREHQEDAQ